VLVFQTEPHAACRRCILGLAIGECLVGLHHLGIHQAKEPSRRESAEHRGDLGVDPPCSVLPEVAGRGSDLAGHPHVQTPFRERRPQLREPSLDVHRVGHLSSSGQGMHLQSSCELRRAVLIDGQPHGSQRGWPSTRVAELVRVCHDVRQSPLPGELQPLELCSAY
jgi:hypothetical protein